VPVSPLNLAGYATQTPAVFPSPSLPPTEIPSPTPTPQIYTLKSGDTLGKIAERFGLSLETLQKANPGVEATSLKVGETLVIPPGAGYLPPVAFPATPVPLEPGPVHCYPAPSGTDCLAAIHNPTPKPLKISRLKLSY
jgi:LysM repeat protein